MSDSPTDLGPGRTGVSVNDDDYDEKSRLLSKPKNTSYTNAQGDQNENPLNVEIVLGREPDPTQHSLVTIFSMWNTMMGTSLLSMPWAILQAGFVNGIILLQVMAGIMAYTSYRVLHSGHGLEGFKLGSFEFTDVVREYLGRGPAIATLLCSLLTLLGGAIVYWILMSNFLYHIVIFIYSHANPSANNHGNGSLIDSTNGSGIFNFILQDDDLFPSSFSDAVCSNTNNSNEDIIGDSTFNKVWDETNTVPFFMILILFPLFNFKSKTFFSKFNSLGSVTVTYLFIFVIVKVSKWGFHLDLNAVDTTIDSYSAAFEWTFPALTGVAALAYFLQNCVVALIKPQRYPENNFGKNYDFSETRDLIIAYLLVCFTYTFMGAIFYASFPLNKYNCIEDNFLNNFASTDILAFVARVSMFFQMMFVLPTLLFIFREQFLLFFFKSAWPSVKHVVGLNVIVVAVCVVFAIFLPHIGHIIGFVGAFCGFSYAIAFPCVVYLMASQRQGTLTYLKIGFHGVLILIGLANFIAQFVLIGKAKGAK